MATSTRFPNLTVPVISTADFAQIAAQLIYEYETDFLAIQQVAKTLAPGDPVRILLLRYSARESQIRSLINYTFQQNFILSSTGDNLKAIGSNYGDLGLILPAASAVTNLTFSLASAVNVDVIIPLGTTVAGGNIPFATNSLVTIVAGQTSVSVLATCTLSGIIGNGYTAGQINTIVGFNPAFVVTAANTTTTQGGADVESDDAFAKRLALVPGGFSVAGPAAAYIFWVKSASSSIADVALIGPPTTAAGTVNIYILLQNGVLPLSPFLATVATFVYPKRPLTDTVVYAAPAVTTYNVTLTYYIDPSNSPLSTQIQAAVLQAIADFNTLTSTKIGRTINPSTLYQMIRNAGASDAVITAPTDTLVDNAHVGQQSGTMTITYGGLRNA